MTEALAVFFVQFVYVMLLGLQSLNVNNRHYAGAFATSLLLGTMGFWLTSVIATYRQGAVGSLLWWAYVLGGPLGIVCSMLIHPRLVQLWTRKK